MAQLDAGTFTAGQMIGRWSKHQEVLMRQRLATSLTAVVLSFGAPPSAAAAQAASIPMSLGVTASPSEVNAGGTATFEVRLKNFRGDTVAAQEDATVTLRSALSTDASLRFKAGQSVAQTDITFQRSGIANLVAMAPHMNSGTAAIVVKAGAGAGAAIAVSAPAGARSAIASAPAPSPAFARAAATLPKIMLAVDVLPKHVHPSNGSWQAKVLVTAVDENGQPVAVQTDTPIQLAIDIGLVSPGQVQIEAGHARTGQPIQVTSDKPGTGRLWAWTDNGGVGRTSVDYHNPMPTQLAVKGVPSHTLNDGRTAAKITVFLQDEESDTVKAEEDVQVKLISSVGTPNPSMVSIPRGQFVGEATLTSATAGVAEITATTPGLKPGVASVEFVFPYLLVLLAAAGGMVGALVQSGGATFTGAWRWHLSGSLAIGSVLGLLFYLLALLGVVASIPKLTIPLGQLPTTNEFGALVLGFFGGYYACAWMAKPAHRSQARDAIAQP
jgi:hypothetical protein